MKYKVVLVCLGVIILLSGCSNSIKSNEENKITTYNNVEVKPASEENKELKIEDFLSSTDAIATSNVYEDNTSNNLDYIAYGLPEEVVKKVFSENEKYIWFSGRRNAHMFARDKYLNEAKDVLNFTNKDEFSITAKNGDTLVVSKINGRHSISLGENSYAIDLDSLEKEFQFSDKYSGRVIAYTNGIKQGEFIKECSDCRITVVVENLDISNDINFEGATVLIEKTGELNKKLDIKLHETNLSKTYNWEVPSNFSKIVQELKEKKKIEGEEVKKFVKEFNDNIYKITQEDFVR